MIIGESITSFPLPYVISKYGDVKPRKIALTFDDGPDPDVTPRILDILDRERVPATFFITGDISLHFPL